ncbi:hypothetical protein WJX73_007734 [Symbiochloris irregularis]|uniref:Pre-mRNA cleavage factor Im 25 kDa subunit n=1 Tax=Symbiochloris irregularis TaxID=706552 RepID=A0AAW1NLL4_9CHLO
MAGRQTNVTLHPLANYNFGSKAEKVEKDATLQERTTRLKALYQQQGMRRSVEAILLVHQHRHPHLLLLQVNASFFKLPGGRLRPHEDEVAGLKRKLHNTLSPEGASLVTNWEVGECAATFWRSGFEPAMYPYIPPHITKPKEVKRLFLVPMPERCYLAVPKNVKLVAVPLFELYDNLPRFGMVISQIPIIVSRVRFAMANDQSAVEKRPSDAPTLGSEQQGDAQGQA